MLGTLANVMAIMIGGAIGAIFRKGIPARYNETLLDAMCLAVIWIGLKGAFKSEAFLLVIMCLVLGTIMGEFLALEARLEAMGQWIEVRFVQKGEGFAKGFVTASLLYCIGSMAVLGALESGLTGNHQILFAKSAIDGIMSVVLASSMGPGVILASLSVLAYQGLITVCATFLESVLVPEVVRQMSAVGGLLIVATGINMMQLKRIKVGNMLPAIFLPIFYFLIRRIIF